MPVRERKEVQKMLRKRLVIFILFLFCLPCFGADQFAPGQILVKFKPDTVTIREKEGVGIFSLDKAEINSSSIKSLNARFRIQKIKSFAKKERKIKKLRSGAVVELPDLSQIYLLEFPKDIDVMIAVQEYRKDPSVEFAEPNYVRTIFTPNDPAYRGGAYPDHDPNQWGLYKIGFVSLEAGNSGWNITTGTNEVRVAVIDTGANYIHEDLVNRVDSLEGYDFVNGDSDPFDDNGHGSHVSGIIGAETNNGKGIAGVNWNCRIIPIKSFGVGGTAWDSDIISGLIWAVSKEADVVNMSFGSTGLSDAVQEAISYAATSDCVLVAAAGNDTPSTPIPFTSYPAVCDGVISVASTDGYDHRSIFSNYGSWIDVSAPGGQKYEGVYGPHDIKSAWIPDNAYEWKCGTSMATPFVAGLAALMRGIYPTMTAEAISQKLIDAADNIDALNPGYEGMLGKGRINALRALTTLHANISSPANGGAVAAGTIQIRGSASGEGFEHYTVEWGTGESPSVFIAIKSSSTPVINGVLATLDTSDMIDSYVTEKLTVYSLTDITEETTATFYVAAFLPPTSLPKAEYGPNPFNPKKGPVMIMYQLAADDDIDIYFYDVSGGLMCRKSYPRGSSGGSQGINRVYWDGVNDFGETVANGVYLFRIASGNKTIEKGKIVVLK